MRIPLLHSQPREERGENLENLGWTPRHAKVQNKLIAVSIDDNELGTDVRDNSKKSPGSAEPSTTMNTELIVTPANATLGLVAHVLKDGDTGKGEANYAATWDEIPNGRFGDINSPAFGSQDLWGGFGRIVSAIHAPLFCFYTTAQQWPNRSRR